MIHHKCAHFQGLLQHQTLEQYQSQKPENQRTSHHQHRANEGPGSSGPERVRVIVKVTQPVSRTVRTQIPNVGLRDPKLPSSPAQASTVWLRKQSCPLQEHFRGWERKGGESQPPPKRCMQKSL